MDNGALRGNRDAAGGGQLQYSLNEWRPVLARSRILVAVSTPWAGERLVRTLSDLAGRMDASIVVAHVMQVSEEDETESDARRRGELTLSTLTGSLAEAGVAAEGVLLFGDDVARAILNAAEAHHVTLIAMGASGKGRMSRLLAGDVPQQIARQADRPVLIFPPDWSGQV